jgi:hypothetical protein
LANFIVERSLLGQNQEVFRQAVAKLNTKSNLTDKERFDLYHSKDYQSKAALRTEAVDLRVLAKMIGLDFFERIELAHDEVPGYELDDPRPRIPVTVVSQFGGSAQTIWSANNTRTLFELGLLESDRVKTQRFDIYQGFVNKNDKLNRDIAESITDKLDDMAWVAIEAGIGALDANTWILDGKIKNAPTTNSIDLSADCQGKLNKAFFKGVSEHFDRVGKPIRAVYIPSARKSDLYDFVSVTDAGLTNTALDTVPADVARDIWGTGNISGGLIPPMVFTNVLEGETPGSIYAYAITNEAPGYFFQKPAFHLTDEKDEGAWHYAQTVLTGSFVIPAYRKMNIAKFKIG